MNTLALNKAPKTKKLIDLPNDVCRQLAVQAASMGLSVKKLIENIVIGSIEDSNDDAIFTYLCETRPEGGEMISDQEQEELFAELKRKVAEDEV